MPAPVTVEVGSTLAPLTPSASSRAPRSLTTALTPAGESRSDWLRTARVTAPWFERIATNSSCSRASAYFCGSVAQTKTSTSSRMRSASTRCRDLARVEVGQVEQHQPVERADRARRQPAGRAVPASCRTTCGRPTPSQSSSSDRRRRPRGRPSADVVGRRAPMAATSPPTRALKREDLPLPVAPASATTVWSPAMPERSTALSTTRRATSTLRLELSAPGDAGPSTASLAGRRARRPRPSGRWRCPS